MSRRRQWIFGAAALVGAAAGGLYLERRRRWAAASAARANAPPERPPGVPVGPFDATSTAEQVTEGLDLSGRTFLVTGVTSGLGKETMRVLALRGAHVLGTGRTLDKARAACVAVTVGRATPLELELTDYAGVVRCAEQVRAMGVPLDAVVCNAGIMALRDLEQVEGVEKQFATNHLGHFLLVNRLRESILSAPQGRVVVVSSGVLSWASPAGIEWDNLSGERDYDPNRMYGQSKLANALFSLALARRFAGTPATSNALHPGYVDTKLFRHYPVALTGFRGLWRGRSETPVSVGASTQTYLTTAPALAQISGHYFMYCNPVVPDPRASDAAAAERLWLTSEQLLRRYLAA